MSDRRARRQLVANGRDRDPGALLEREPADARAERREGDARHAGLASSRHRAANGRFDRRRARPPVAIERDGVDDEARGQGAGRRDDGTAEWSGRLPDGREFDRVTAGPLEGSTDTGRHPQRRVGGVDDRIDLEVADVAVPELDLRH